MEIKINPYMRDLILAQQAEIESAHRQIGQMQTRLSGLVHGAAVQSSDRPLTECQFDLSQIRSCTIILKDPPKPKETEKPNGP